MPTLGAPPSHTAEVSEMCFRLGVVLASVYVVQLK